MPIWAAALCVAAIWLVAGGVLAVYGRRKLDEMGTAVPSRTIEAVKEDVEWLAHQKS
jgi:Putative Actinobacterial Holin-X, holin superfamily III